MCTLYSTVLRSKGFYNWFWFDRQRRVVYKDMRKCVNAWKCSHEYRQEEGTPVKRPIPTSCSPYEGCRGQRSEAIALAATRLE